MPLRLYKENPGFGVGMAAERDPGTAGPLHQRAVHPYLITPYFQIRI